MVLNQTASLLAQSMRESEDELARNMLAATCSQVNCTQGVNGDIPTELSRADIDDVVRTLINANAMMITDDIPGSLRFGTAPIRSAFWAMMNAQLLDDLEAVDGFIAEAQYPASMNILNAEWGSVGNTRWLYSSIGSVSPNASSSGADVYNSFIVGKEAYGIVELDGQAAEFIYKPLGAAGTADPLNQRQTCAFKFAEAPVLLNDSWAINLRATHS
jgi:N4-gp56 family major capsid protein